ncbi:MAG: flagellar assembly protein FliH [Treponema sp.]|nr:flagellar assembly protein FliH [Treponema sp.]
MAKAVFRPNELTIVQERMMIENPVHFTDFTGFSAKEVEVEAEIEPEREKYIGPTAEDLRREAEEFRMQWEVERQVMMESAKAEAAEIVQTASLAAEQERQQATSEADAIRAAAKEEAGQIITDVRQQADELNAETRKTLEDEKKEAIEQGREAGRSEGYAEGKAEVDRLIERTRVVLERAQDKRGEILSDTEREVIDLVLLMSRKVVKVISENQREVVVSNIVQALRKIRDRGNIIIRVNLADLKLTTAHTKDFIKMMEGAKSIQVAEDSSVDPGGCVIETDFGEIDARISSQLAELETKIREISPIKSKVKSGVAR